MTPLDQIPLFYRALLTFAVIVIVLILLSLVGCYLGEGDAAQSVSANEPPLSKYDEHLLALDREALDKAYKDHIKLVFSIWMKGPTDPESPRRAGTGARNAREGYLKSVEAIERREQRLKEFKP